MCANAAVLRVCVSNLSDWQASPPRSLLAHTHNMYIKNVEHNFQLRNKINTKTSNNSKQVMLNQAERKRKCMFVIF